MLGSQKQYPAGSWDTYLITILNLTTFDFSAATFLEMKKHWYTCTKNLRHYFQVGIDLIEEETAETERVKLAIYLYYAKAIGIKITVASVLLYSCFQVGTMPFLHRCHFILCDKLRLNRTANVCNNHCIDKEWLATYSFISSLVHLAFQLGYFYIILGDPFKLK